MNTSRELAPAVESILDAAVERGPDDGSESGDRVSADARAFPAAVAETEADGRVPVVAEVKPTSPTTDGERLADPVALAESMVAGGATALSVLTEPDHFGGSTAALAEIRAAVDVPVLRKDFLLRESQLDAVESDLVLLIARFLGEDADVGDRETDDLAELIAAVRERGMEPLVEVHSREELATALDADAEIIGVNNRDLTQLEVDLDTFESVAPDAPEDVTLLAESGIGTAAEARRMRDGGADALLIGSAIMEGVEDADDEQAVRELVESNTRRFTTAETQTTTMTDTTEADR
jgi:indole-3-glycerol phosphate synthase